MYNAIAQAFVNASAVYVKQADKHGKFKASWHASLSYRTHKQLVSQGIL